MKKLITMGLLLLSSQVFAAGHTQDTSVIENFYVHGNGKVAVTITGGFPNAAAKFTCSTSGANSYAGVSNVDPFLKAALLAAKKTGKQVRITIDGCEGPWFRIMDLYIL